MFQRRVFGYVLILNLLLCYCLVEPVGAASCSELCHYYSWARDADCSRRHLSRIPLECVGSKVLNLNRNIITEIPSHVFSTFAHLKYLQIRDSQVQTIQANSFAGANRLKSINLQLNTISGLPEHSFNDTRSLEWLYLTGNQITTIESGVFQETPQLEMLYLDNNQLDHLDEGVFQGLSRMQRLLLGGNKLKRLPIHIFRDLTLLTDIDLSRNRLQSLSRDTFRSLKKLQTINLAGNALVSIAPGSFSSSSVAYLDISYNALTTLTLGQVPFLEKLNGTGNHWNCDCSLDPLRQTLQAISQHGVLCQLPEPVAGTDIISHASLCSLPTPSIPIPDKGMEKNPQMDGLGYDLDDTDSEVGLDVIIGGYPPVTVTLIVVSTIIFAFLVIGMLLLVFCGIPSFQMKRKNRDLVLKEKHITPKHV